MRLPSSSGLTNSTKLAASAADAMEPAAKPFRAARRLIADLPEPFRETLILREINDLSYREIAGVVDAPVGTVMSRLARARALLRKAWIAEENKP